MGVFLKYKCLYHTHTCKLVPIVYVVYVYKIGTEYLKFPYKTGES